jgi:hypothetical protein
VICVSLVPSAFIEWISYVPLRFETNAILFPSGDHESRPFDRPARRSGRHGTRRYGGVLSLETEEPTDFEAVGGRGMSGGDGRP